MPLMQKGVSVNSILFFRYIIAVAVLGLFLLLTKQRFKVSAKQAGVLIILGILYSSSSIFLYPVLVAIIMVFLKVVPSWPVWLSIFATFAGVIIMTQGGSGEEINPVGVLLSLGSAFVYALFIVIINRSKVISSISNSLLTFYALLTGAVIFFGKIMFAGSGLATRNIGATKASVLGVF